MKNVWDVDPEKGKELYVPTTEEQRLAPEPPRIADPIGLGHRMADYDQLADTLAGQLQGMLKEPNSLSIISSRFRVCIIPAIDQREYQLTDR